MCLGYALDKGLAGSRKFRMLERPRRLSGARVRLAAQKAAQCERFLQKHRSLDLVLQTTQSTLQSTLLSALFGCMTSEFRCALGSLQEAEPKNMGHVPKPKAFRDRSTAVARYRRACAAARLCRAKGVRLELGPSERLSGGGPNAKCGGGRLRNCSFGSLRR